MNPGRTGWRFKFACAIKGVGVAVKTNTSFWAHVPITVAVIAVAAWLNVEAWRWTALVLATAMVWATELLNSSIEDLVRVLHPQHDPRIGRVLDVAAGAVLITAIGAVTVGLLVLGPPLIAMVVG